MHGPRQSIKDILENDYIKSITRSNEYFKMSVCFEYQIFSHSVMWNAYEYAVCTFVMQITYVMFFDYVKCDYSCVLEELALTSSFSPSLYHSLNFSSVIRILFR